MKSWKLKELKFIKENLHLSDNELSKQLNRTLGSVKYARVNYNLTKGKKVGHFKKMHVPFNAGKKLIETHSKEGLEKISTTKFKKGHQPKIVRKFGEVFLLKGDGEKYYKHIKLPEHRQYPYGRYVYEQHTGTKLEKNEIIRFKDGDPLNCDFDNLMKISRAENAKQNVNRSKAANSLRLVWASVRTFEDFGLTPVYKFRSKRKKTG